MNAELRTQNDEVRKENLNETRDFTLSRGSPRERVPRSGG
jgi:hypothetical protein